MLLDATIEHVQALKKSGTLYLDVSPQTLKDLQKPLKQPQVAPTVETPRPVAAPRPHPTPVTPDLPAPAPAGEETKEAAMANLRARVLGCLKCPNLVATRKNVVFGVGNVHSPLMFVGEAPGADEDIQGEPFVGAAGRLLTKIIGAMGLTRESVYIGNVLKCRPDTPGQTSGNRKPNLMEMKTCLPNLQEQIDIIAPKVIVALGATAMEGLQGTTVYITKIRGRFQSYRGIPLMPTYHPAYLLRNQAMSEKRKVWEDMLAVMEKLGMPISDKQRGYFLRGA